MSEAAEIPVGAVTFIARSMSAAIADTLRCARSGVGVHLHFANAWSVVVARDSSAMRNSLASGICYPDGLPVVWAMRASKALTETKPERVKGPDFFAAMLEAGQAENVTHFLLGSTEKTLASLEDHIAVHYPRAQIVGRSAPPFAPIDDTFVENELIGIRASGASIVWVGLGTPKQDIFAAIAASHHTAVFACVGAAFDMLAGNVRRAPGWMSRVGLEWLYRFAQEPRRLWRRYTYGNVAFIAIALQTVFRSGRLTR